MRAAQTFGIRAPLMEAGLTKPDIRKLSRKFGLPTADLPASPCLASRLPYGLDITPERLSQVEQAEMFLRQFGLSEFRVRHHGNLARIEVRPDQFSVIISEPNKTKITDKLKALGFTFVCVDLQGFRSGAQTAGDNAGRAALGTVPRRAAGRNRRGASGYRAHCAVPQSRAAAVRGSASRGA